MQTPLAINGEEEVKNLGQPRISSLRQIFLPLAASRHESAPRIPRVTTFPSATAGELLGPEKLEAAPCAPCVSYLSCHSSLPAAASRHRKISLPSWREKT